MFKDIRIGMAMGVMFALIVLLVVTASQLVKRTAGDVSDALEEVQDKEDNLRLNFKVHKRAHTACDLSFDEYKSAKRQNRLKELCPPASYDDGTDTPKVK